jgi:hypothetical protein
MSLCNPARSRVYPGMKVARDPSSQRQERMAGAPWPETNVNMMRFQLQHGAPTWAYDVQKVVATFTNDIAEMGVYEGETRACTPVTEKTRFDIGRGQIPLKQNIVVEKDHGYETAVSAYSTMIAMVMYPL